MVILYDRFNLPEDVYEIVFATKQQAIVGKLLVNYMKENDGEITKTEMSLFATSLHDGEYFADGKVVGINAKKVKFSYNKRQFYDRILTPMKGMGIIDYDLYKKTYKLSEHFNKDLIRIGLLWLRELRKPSLNLKIKQ